MASPTTSDPEPDVRYIGCCGAYCRTCPALREGACSGCKLGYGRDGRKITRARCAMKLCCFRDRGLETCADCPDYSGCETIGEFQRRKGHKYKKYRESIEYIRENGYSQFSATAGEWKGPYGRL